MAQKDLKNRLAFAQSVNPAAKTASASGTSSDLAGYNSLVYRWQVGTVTDGTHTPSLEESDDDSTYTAVAAADIQGTAAALVSNTAQTLGYLGAKRYVRPKTTVATATTGGVYGVTAILGHPRNVAP